MKKFKFPLEKVLKYKAIMEEEKHLELIRTQEQYHEQVFQLNALRDKVKTWREVLHREVLSINMLSHGCASVEILEKYVEIQEEKVRQAFEEMELARGIFLGVRRERRVLERLKEKMLREYESAQAAEMQKDLDEIAVSAYVRQN